MNSLVSIIIPAYNVAPYIAQCLESVIAQTYPHIEIIVVDDGSTDETHAIAQTYAQKDRRIRIVQKQNGGLSSARNAGLKAATGDYLVLFDSDDLMIPTKIAHHIQWLEAHTEYSCVYSDLIHFYDKTTKMYKLSIPTLGQDQYLTLLRGNCINPNTFCMKREVYEAVGGFDESIRSAEDWEYWLRVTREGMQIGYQADYLTLYRMRADSLSADRVTMCMTALQVLQKQEQDIVPKYSDALHSEIVLWKHKLTLAHMKKEVENSRGLQRLWYMMLAYIIQLGRTMKLWWRLKPYTNESFKHLLISYGTK